MGAAPFACLLYTSDAADERSSVDLGGRRIITKKKANTQISPAQAVSHVELSLQQLELRRRRNRRGQRLLMKQE